MTDEQTSAFFQPMDDQPTMEESNFASPGGEYIGEIDAAPPAVLIPEEPMILEPVMVTEEPIVIAPGIEDVTEEEEENLAAAAYNEPREASPLSQWNDAWQVTLAERKEVENTTKATVIAASDTDRAEFQAMKEAKRESKMVKNRSEEQDKLEAMEADLENDNSWQRVNKLVELTQDNSDGTVDTTRMRDVLIFLKNDVDRAAILA